MRECLNNHEWCSTWIGVDGGDEYEPRFSLLCGREADQ
jgi:hypothetical protein